MRVSGRRRVVGIWQAGKHLKRKVHKARQMCRVAKSVYRHRRTYLRGAKRLLGAVKKH